LDFQFQRPILPFGAVFSDNMLVLLLALGLTQSAGGDGGVMSKSEPLSTSTTVTLTDSQLSNIKKRASEGDVQAEMDLAEVYARGNGVPANDALAAQWCRRAAEQGNAAAQDRLGTMYASVLESKRIRKRR
jgi:TPR repeat protein